MIAYCGINCGDCKVLEATRNDCEQTRKMMAEEWSEKYGWDLKSDDMVCDGCLVEGGRIFGFCKTCQTRLCARERTMENCAHCEDYGCDKLHVIWGMNASGKANLENIRKSL